MKSKHYLILLSGIVLGLSSAAAFAADGAPARPTPEQRQAIHDCAAAKGVDLPASPAGGPAKGDKPAEGQTKAPPPQVGEGRGPQGVPPKLTEEQRAIVDACFAAQGLTPPKGPPVGGKRGEHKGQPPFEEESLSSSDDTPTTSTATGAKATKSKITGTVKQVP